MTAVTLFYNINLLNVCRVQNVNVKSNVLVSDLTFEAWILTLVSCSFLSVRSVIVELEREYTHTYTSSNTILNEQ